MKQTRVPKIKAELEASIWNKDYPEGTPVVVRKDDGSFHHGITRGPAFLSYSGHAVIFVTGLSGYWLLERVSPAVGKVVA